jgi:lipopolysaccharide/colanic/teichoic acid biosynthesis glycosyltransferase
MIYQEIQGSLGRDVRTWWKRPLDLLIALPTLLALLPLIGILALLVRLESAGPAFYGQERIGRRGQPFRMWKLRTMRAGSEQEAHREAAATWFAGRSHGAGYKSLRDPRITRVGRVLRRTSLDELPQLFNVLLGDMSLVGPRPAIVYELRHYLPEYYGRQDVPPGLTGLWQVSGRHLLPAAEMMRLDLRYVREASLWLDLSILFKTIPAVLSSAFED